MPEPSDESLEEAGVRLESAGQEDEQDLAPGTREEVGRAYVTGTDWTTETVLSQLDQGNIDLNPRFQRRDAWGKGARKSRFIESLFLGLPVPQLVLAERKDKRNSYLVIDGKQRLLSLRQFAAAPGDEFDPLVLAGLEVRRDLNGSTLASLRASSSHADDVREFENQPIRTVVVRNWPNEDFLYAVFLRLNTGTVALSPQELRQALHPGPFIDFVDDRAASSHQIRQLLGLTEPDFRMRDVELLVRFLAFDFFLARYQGNLKRFLDEACKELNDLWPKSRSLIAERALACDAAIDATFDVFGANAFRRWTGTGYETRFNRAVFDVMTYYFKAPAVAEAAREQAELVRSTFEMLSTKDHGFAQSLVATTKSVEATNTRVDKWGNALAGAIDMDLSKYTFRAFATPKD